MEIKELKINGFGNIKNKEISLDKGINILYGKNESGKSTLFKYITNMLYGSSKNKKGRDISDLEQYTPWQAENFSGKMTYTLEDGETYQVFREFKKKNPVIYNEQGEDISKKFSIDKTKGINFFYEQTKIEEETFLASTAVIQQEVKLDASSQNKMIQKLANLAGTGEEQVSVKRALEYLNKKQLEEIGTARSLDRPLNQVEETIQELTKEKIWIEQQKDKMKQAEQTKIILQKKEEQVIQEIQLLKQIQQSKKEKEIQQAKIKGKEEVKQEKEKQRQVDEKQKEEVEQESKIGVSRRRQRKNKQRKMMGITLFILSLIVCAVSVIVLQNAILLGIFASIGLFSLLYFLRVFSQEKKEEQQEVKLQQEEKKQTQVERTRIEKEIQELEEQIKQMEQKMDEEMDIALGKVESQWKRQMQKPVSYCYDLWEKDIVEEELEALQEQMNEMKIQEHMNEVERQTNQEKIEKLANIEETLQEKEEQRQELKRKERAIQIAKEKIEESYSQMKKTITPKFTQYLSKTIAQISKGKYQKVMFNSENGLMVETQEGRYRAAEQLSTGTIDQLYLSLRIAMIQEMSKEKMPLILDEAFAYYDESRLEEILRYFAEEITNQILIFTCTNREREILDTLKIPYHYIEM